MTAPLLPDAAMADPAGYVLAVADLRELRIGAAAPGVWSTEDGGTSIRAEDRPRLIAVTGTVDRPVDIANGVHIAAEANPAHALAGVALWRLLAAEHTPVPGVSPPTCAGCPSEWGVVDEDGYAPGERVDPVWPCETLLAVVAACQAYTGATP